MSQQIGSELCDASRTSNKQRVIMLIIIIIVVHVIEWDTLKPSVRLLFLPYCIAHATETHSLAHSLIRTLTRAHSFTSSLGHNRLRTATAAAL